MTSLFLRRVLLADAIVSGAAGLLMIAGAGVLAPLLDLPRMLLVIAGAALVPWVVALVTLVRMPAIPRAAVRAVVAVNVAWVAASAIVLFVLTPNLLGYGFVITQAVAVAVFAELQMVALKRELGAGV